MSFSNAFNEYSLPLLSVGNIPYTYGSACPSWNKRGEEIKEGKSKERLCLVKNDTRVDVKAKICVTSLEKIIADMGCLLGLYAKLDEETYVNIASIKKRLHVETHEIKKAIQDQRLYYFLKTHAQNTSRVLTAFEDLIKKVDLTIRKSLSDQQWMEKIRHSVQLLANEHSTFTRLQLNEEVYHLGFHPTTKKIALWHLEQVRGNGKDIEIRNFTDLINGETMRVFKTHETSTSSSLTEKRDSQSKSTHVFSRSRSNFIPDTLTFELEPNERITLKNSTAGTGDYIQIS